MSTAKTTGERLGIYKTIVMQIAKNNALSPAIERVLLKHLAEINDPGDAELIQILRSKQKEAA